MWNIVECPGIKQNNNDNKEIWKISQLTHLSLNCRLLVDGSQGGIKTAKLNLFTVGRLYTVSLCEKYVGKSPSNCGNMSKGKETSLATSPVNEQVHRQPPSVPEKCSWRGTTRGQRQVTAQIPG